MPRRFESPSVSIPVFLAMAFASASAFAVDGVIEINEARVIVGNITPGDSPGYPITISRPGHYRLTGNLDISGEANAVNTFIFNITADDVAIDLNGFSLLGPTSCTGLPPNQTVICTPVGGGTGISAGLAERFSVSNGSIRGMGANAVSCGTACTVSGVLASDNGNNGISVGVGGRVLHSTAEGNRFQGIDGNEGAQVMHSVARRNGGTGITTGPGSLVASCVATRNSGVGLGAGNNTTGYLGNVFHLNNGGNANAQVISGTQIGTNLCGGSTVCP